MKLKTLKDFDCKGCYCKLAPELKQEAIKWVKEKRLNSPCGECKDGEKFMEFFNITEEDLK